MSPKFASFEALLAHLTASHGTTLDPTDGEPAGAACPQCGVVPRYRRTERGAWRIEMIHGRHGTGLPDAVPELAPPRRIPYADD